MVVFGHFGQWIDMGKQRLHTNWSSTLDMLDRTPNFLITYFLLSNFHENKQALPYDSSATNMQGGIEGKERGPRNLPEVHFAFYKLYYYNL